MATVSELTSHFLLLLTVWTLWANFVSAIKCWRVDLMNGQHAEWSNSGGYMCHKRINLRSPFYENNSFNRFPILTLTPWFPHCARSIWTCWDEQFDTVSSGQVGSAGVDTRVVQLCLGDDQSGHGGVGRGHPQPALLLSCKKEQK